METADGDISSSFASCLMVIICLLRPPFSDVPQNCNPQNLISATAILHTLYLLYHSCGDVLRLFRQFDCCGNGLNYNARHSHCKQLYRAKKELKMIANVDLRPAVNYRRIGIPESSWSGRHKRRFAAQFDISAVPPTPLRSCYAPHIAGNPTR